jgi:hypothetical membrane protein
MRSLTTNQKKSCAWAGIIAPVLFVLVFTIESFLRPGYDPMKTFISALSLGSRGWIQIANFILFGILLLLFTLGVANEFKKGKASKWGVILLAALGSCYLLSGPFVMDATGTPLSGTSFHGILHGIFGAIVFVVMPISCFVFLRRFREDPKWKGLYGWTLALGILVALGVLLMIVGIKIPTTAVYFTNWIGLIQRIALVAWMTWLFGFGVGILKRI